FYRTFSGFQAEAKLFLECGEYRRARCIDWERRVRATGRLPKFRTPLQSNVVQSLQIRLVDDGATQLLSKSGNEVRECQYVALNLTYTHYDGPSWCCASLLRRWLRGAPLWRPNRTLILRQLQFESALRHQQFIHR